jgi:hypothetical protein
MPLTMVGSFSRDSYLCGSRRAVQVGLSRNLRCELADELSASAGVIGGQEVDLRASVDVKRRWQLNGLECASVQGTLDIDLGFSPSTNLLPIRRLQLAVGGEAEIRAAWLPYPSLEFEPVSGIPAHRRKDLSLRVGWRQIRTDARSQRHGVCNELSRPMGSRVRLLGNGPCHTCQA